MYTVNVLLSSYNGEKYIEEQIDSVLAQEGVNVVLTVRDDGSKDSTKEILEKYKKENKLNWYTGDNLRPAKSFLNLVKNSIDADYYAFCDQDDFWEKDKLKSAVDMLEKEDNSIPLVYHSAYQMVDSRLNPLSVGGNDYFSDTLYKAIISSNSTGCTVVFNKATRDLLNKHDIEQFLMHDNYIVKLALACGGKIIHDTTPHILYRQHENNVIGGTSSKKSVIKRHIKSITDSPRYRSNSIIAMYEKYKDDFSEEGLKICQEICNYRKGINRFKLAFNGKYRTHNKRIDALFVVAVLIGAF